MPYLKEIHTEYLRIGFTEEELRHMASGAEPDEAALREELERLRAIPSGIGAEEYHRREGLNYEPIREAVEFFRGKIEP